MKYFKKIAEKIISLRVKGVLARAYNYLNPQSYMRNYVKYLRFCGVNVKGTPNYISSDVYFDGHDYSLITLGDGVVISMQTIFLTHDYSIARGIESVQGKYWKREQTPFFLREIEVGNNCFIGLRCILLPGTHIGDNCVIGAGSVVKGIIPANSVVAGNPAKVIAKTDEWARRHLEARDYYPIIRDLK